VLYRRRGSSKRVKVGIDKLAPHDLRRTCARLCHTAGGEPEQIQFLLGHVSANSEQPQRKIARAILSTVNYTTTETTVFSAFLNSAKAQDAYAYSPYHEQLGL